MNCCDSMYTLRNFKICILLYYEIPYLVDIQYYNSGGLKMNPNKYKWRLSLIIALILIGISIYINMQTKVMPQTIFIEPDSRWYGIQTLLVYSESDKDMVEITLKNEDRDKITELINNTTVSAFEVSEPRNAKNLVTQTAVAGNGIPFDFSIHKTSWGNYYILKAQIPLYGTK